MACSTANILSTYDIPHIQASAKRRLTTVGSKHHTPQHTSMKQEVEILWRLNEDVPTALAKLDPSKFVHTKHTIDTYYYDPLRTDLQPSPTGRLQACLRVRETNKGGSCTYKLNHFQDDTWLYSDEIETAVTDATELKQVFTRLGLEILVVVELDKHVFDYGTHEIVIESVKDLGGFIEVEYHAHDEVPRDPLEIKQSLFAFAAGLGVQLGDEENAGKPELLIKQRGLSTAG